MKLNWISRLFSINLAIALILLLIGCTGIGQHESAAAETVNVPTDKEIIDQNVGKNEGIARPIKPEIVKQRKDKLSQPSTVSEESSAGKKFEEHKPTMGKTIKMAAVGDVLIHDVVYNAARTSTGYDFNPLFKEVKPYLSEADITFANQESMIGGTALGVRSYPRFNSPFEVGDALRDAGVDIVSMANNHTLDAGQKAVMQATNHWNRIGMKYVGSYQNAADQDKVRVMHTPEGISVAFLAFTYGTNGLTVPADKNYLVNLIDEKRIAAEVKKARQQADAVVLSLHFGDEYKRQPNKAQEKLVRFAAKVGADVILGHHPHVLQPVEWIEGKDGKKTLVIYSLGNFISGQKNVYKQTGGILTWEIAKTTTKSDRSTDIIIQKPRFMLTYVPYGKWTPEPMQRVNGGQAYTEMKKHMSGRMPDLQFIEE